MSDRWPFITHRSSKIPNFNRVFTQLGEKLHELCSVGLSPQFEMGIYVLHGFGKRAAVLIAVRGVISSRRVA